MDRLQAMQVFVRVAETGSFTRAAGSMQLPRSTVSAVVKQMEDHLGVRLLNRTTRSVGLTLDGEAYLERCKFILQELEEAESLLLQRTSGPSGKLRVDVPGRIARTVIIPALPDFFATYPDIELELGVTDRPVDLIQEAVDCAIRVGELSDSRLVARRIGMLAQGSYASPQYLEKYGTPEKIDDLDDHLAVNYASPLTGQVYEWEYISEAVAQTRPIRSMVTVNNAEAYIACARAGLGLIQIPAYDAKADIESGHLVEVLSAYRPEPLPVSALYPHRRHLSRRVRAFVDWVTVLFERAMFKETG